MTFEFEDKSKGQSPGDGKASQVEQPALKEADADVMAERRRVWNKAEEIARRRRERVAAVRSGKLAQAELDASELIILEHYERIEESRQHESFISNLARRFAGTGLGVIAGSIVTAASSVVDKCTTNPFLFRLAGVLGGLGLVVLAVAVALWIYRQLFL